MILSGELLKEAKSFIEYGIHSQIIINGYWKALTISREKMKELSFSINEKSPEEKRNLLLRCAKTSLKSK
jgi:T-complex protein 1 subunit eta